MKILLGGVAALAALASASSALADRFVVLSASENSAYAANLDARSDQPNGVTRFEVETVRYGGRQARYLIITEEANCAKGQLRPIQTHAMITPTFEAAKPEPAIPEWATPMKGSLDEVLLKAGCAPSFPKASVVDTGDGDHDYRPVLEGAVKIYLGLKPTDPLPAIGARRRADEGKR